MSRYEKYKDSGIAWIGEIPDDWDIQRMKYSIEKSFAGVWGDDANNCDTDVRCFRVADFNYNQLNLSDNNPTKRNIDLKTFEQRKVLQGDILLEKSGGGEKTPVGRAVYVNINENAICSNFVHCIRTNSNTKNKFLVYMFSYMYNSNVNLLYFNQTTGIQNLNVADYLNNAICTPSFAEQEAIAEFLDSKCGEIDELIALQEKMIEELGQYKQSVITEAVTRGLNPDAPLKDSGIEWIGKIPEHWDNCKLKNLFRTVSGSTPKTDFEPFWDGDIVWITPADYKTEDRVIISGRRNITMEGVNSCGTTIIPIDSIIFSKRAPIGLVAINKVPLCTNQGCISCIPNKNTNTQFYYYLISVLTEQFELLGSGTTFKEISANSFNSFHLIVPPLSEQQAIADYLDRKCKEIDELTEIKRQKIDQLKEYKKSIIYEYVTGKKRVNI